MFMIITFIFNIQLSLFVHFLQSVILDMSIENMNSLRLIPQKNYQVNRITAGMLQLTPGTHLVLDETELRQGQLNHTGLFVVLFLRQYYFYL